MVTETGWGGWMKGWGWGLIGTGMIVVIMFWPYWRWGKVPIAIDIPTGMYYPWLNYNYGYPVHVPVKNAILSDTISQFWIWRNWAVEGLKQGQIKIWNPYLFSGYEMSPWFGSVMLQPLNLFYWLTDKLDAMALVVISQIAISLLGAWAWGRQIYKNKLAAGILAVSWTMSSYFIGWMSWGTVSLGLALLPWGLATIDSWRGLAIVIGLIVLSGHPQTVVYMLGIIVIYGLIKQRWKKVAIGIVLGLGLTAIVWWPSIGIIRNSIRLREATMGTADYGFIAPIKNIVLLLSPNFWGNPGTNNYWGSGPNFQENLVNFGIVGLVLAITGGLIVLGQKKKDEISQLAGICVILGVLLVQKYPLGWLVYFLKIPLWASCPAGRAWVLAIFGGSVLAGKGAEEILKGKEWKKSWQKAIMISAGLGLVAGAYLLGLEKRYWVIAGRNLAVSGWWWLMAVTAMAAAGKKEKMKELTIIGLLILMAAEGLWFNWKYTPFVDKKLFFPETATTKFLKEDKELFFRTERQSAELLPPNMWQIYGLYSTSGYDPISPASYDQYLIKKETRKMFGRYVENGNANEISKLDELGIKYWLILRETTAGNPLPKWVEASKWEEVFNEGRVAVLKKKNYQPAYELEKSGEVRLTEKNETGWKFTVETKTDNRLILRENYSDNWKVKVDGAETKAEKIEDTFKAVTVPAGKHEVEFDYQNQGWKAGKIISLTTAAVMVISVAGVFFQYVRISGSGRRISLRGGLEKSQSRGDLIED
jgi:hypothetical protein